MGINESDIWHHLGGSGLPAHAEQRLEERLVVKIEGKDGAKAHAPIPVTASGTVIETPTAPAAAAAIPIKVGVEAVAAVADPEPPTAA